MKSLLVKCALVAGIASAAFADEKKENICDTLSTDVNLKLAYVNETLWYGNKDLSRTDSSKTIFHTSYETVVPKNEKNGEPYPYSVNASCKEKNDASIVQALWTDRPEPMPDGWQMSIPNAKDGSQIFNIREIEIEGYNEDNSYNILAMKVGGLPEDVTFKSEELLVSKTYEFAFDYWRVLASASVTVGNTTKIYSSMSSGLDSLPTLQGAINNLKFESAEESEIASVVVQILHVVLMDERKIPEYSSSSSAASSCSTAKSSSSAKSSGSAEKSSSSTTGIAAVKVKTKSLSKSREMFRLDGTRVRAGESVTPGVYYVKAANGQWKKQLVIEK